MLATNKAKGPFMVHQGPCAWSGLYVLKVGAGGRHTWVHHGSIRLVFLS